MPYTMNHSIAKILSINNNHNPVFFEAARTPSINTKWCDSNKCIIADAKPANNVLIMQQYFRRTSMLEYAII